MVRTFLNWSDKKCKESLENDNDTLCITKHVALGAAEGCINAIVIVGGYLIVSGLYNDITRAITKK